MTQVLDFEKKRIKRAGTAINHRGFLPRNHSIPQKYTYYEPKTKSTVFNAYKMSQKNPEKFEIFEIFKQTEIQDTLALLSSNDEYMIYNLSKDALVDRISRIVPSDYEIEQDLGLTTSINFFTEREFFKINLSRTWQNSLVSKSRLLFLRFEIRKTDLVTGEHGYNVLTLSLDSEKSQNLKEKNLELFDLKMTSTEKGFILLPIFDSILLINPRYATYSFFKL